MSKADEMFEELGLKKTEIYYNSNIDTIRYSREGKYSSNVEFKYPGKMVVVFYGENKAGNFDMFMLQAINEKVKELGWNEKI